MKNVIKKLPIIVSLIIVWCFTSSAIASIKIPMFNSKTGNSIGYVIAENNHYGLLLIPHLHNLPPGPHGFHIHSKPSCSDHAMAAGGHFDPEKTGKHLGPYNPNGHLGDLPVLIVNPDGTATIPVLAPRLKVQTITNHSLMIHAGSDNYSDTPKKLGGGGKRIACGVIPKLAN